MQAISLLMTRVSTGLYLMIWGADKLFNVEHAVKLSDKFYNGWFSSDVVNFGLGAFSSSGWFDGCFRLNAQYFIHRPDTLLLARSFVDH